MKINGSILTKGPENFLSLDSYRQKQIKDSLKMQLRFEGEDGDLNIIDSVSNRKIINNKCLNGNRVKLSKDWSAFGKTSAKFDGGSSLAIINNSDFTLTNQFTIQFWMKSNVFTSHNTRNRRIFGLGGSDLNSGLSLLAGNSSGSNNFCGLYNTSSWRINGNIITFNNIPHHILISRDINNDIRLFVDGIQSGGIWNTSIIFCAELFVIGGINDWYNSAKYEGYLDEFEIYKGVCLYNSNFTVPLKATEFPEVENLEYSGITINSKVGETVEKHTPMYFDLSSQSWKISKSDDISTLPAKALSLEDKNSNEDCDLLVYGIVKKEKTPTNEYEYQNILPILTANNDKGHILGASSKWTNYEPYEAFNGDKNKSGSFANNFWHTGDATWTGSGFLIIKLDQPRIVTKYSMRPRWHSSYDNEQIWRHWKFAGSHDGKTWELLDIQYNVLDQFTWSYSIYRDVEIINSTAYQFYQFFDIYGYSIGKIVLYDENGNDIIPNHDFKIRVSASSEYSGTYPAWKAFNRTLGTDQSNSWLTANNTLIGWLQVDLGYIPDNIWYNHHKINQYAITTVVYTGGGRSPKVWDLLGSNNGKDWQILDHHDDGDLYFNAPGQRILFNLNQEYSFRYYKLDVLESFQFFGTLGATFLSLNEFELLYNNQNILPKFSTYDNLPCPSHIISSSSEYNGTYPAWKAFNKTNASQTDAWITTNGVKTGFLKIHFLYNSLFPVPKKINKYALTARNDSYRNEPKDWTLQGSNDDINWDILDTQSNIIFIQNERKEFTLSQDYEYNYYKIDVTAVGASQGYVTIGELEFLYNNENIITNAASEYNIYYDSLTTDIISINCSASSEYSSTYKAANCWVDNKDLEESTSTAVNWYTANNALVGWNKIILSTKIPGFEDYSRFSRKPIDSYSLITSWETSEVLRVPVSWTFEGSQNDIDWDILHQVDGDTTSFTGSSQEVKFDLNQTVDYLAYKINVTETREIGGTRNYFGLFAIRLFNNDNLVNVRRRDYYSTGTVNSFGTNIYKQFNRFFYLFSNNSGDTTWFGYLIFDKLESVDNGWGFSNTSSGAETYNRTFGETLQIQLPNRKKIIGIGLKQINLRQYDSLLFHYFTFKGSNDGINWDTIYVHYQNKSLDEVKKSPYKVFFENNNYYSFYKFDNWYIMRLFYVELYEEKSYESSGQNIYINSENNKYLTQFKPKELPEYYIQNIGHKLQDLEDNNELICVDFNSTLINTKENLQPDTIITSNTTISSILDGPMVTKIYKSLTINSSFSLTPSNRCRGLRIVVLGDCIINGTLTMTARGANYPAPNQDLEILDLEGNILTTIPRIGGAGAPRTKIPISSAGANGLAGINGGCGGGGGGGSYSTNCSTGGGRASCFSGGAGGGGVMQGNAKALDGSDDGGRGGDAGYEYNDSTYYARGGAGNPGGYDIYRNGNYAGQAPSGTGGLLILIVYGNLIIGSSGIISSNGIDANTGNSTYCLGGGGGSGGGSINIFHKGEFINNGTIQANGGIGTQVTHSSNTLKGGNGGAGSVRIFQI